MKSSFQTIIIVVFVGAFLFAVAVFSGIFSSGNSQSSEPQGTVLIWGILPQEQMQYLVSTINSQRLGYTLEYREVPAAAFSAQLTTALADNTPPDLVLFSSEIFSQIRNKVIPIPYENYSERLYRDTVVDGAQVFLTQEGVGALPLLVDPMVVYYNKDLLAAENFILTPRSWSDIARSVPLFTTRDSGNVITQTTIALGEGENVVHAKDILSTLFLQTGSPIVSYDRTRGVSEASLNVSGTQEALTYYTSFSNPTSATYSWNRALPSSTAMFLSGRSAFYLGRASELFMIQSQNPNLNFDVIEMFQPQDATRPITFGSFIGISALREAPNIAAAYAALGVMASPANIDALSKRFSLPPVNRQLLLVQQPNPYVAVFFRAALNSFSWPDPNPAATEETFRDMIQDITSGRSDTYTAINEAHREIQSDIR